MRNNKQNYLKIKFSDVIPDPQYTDGISISFMAKDSAKYDSWQRYFELTTCDPYSGGNGSYLYAAVNGNVKIKNVGFSNTETDALSLGNADNEWHRYTIVIDSCYIFTYRDGRETGYITNINVINQNLYDQFLENGYFVFGASSYNDPAYEGYMKDFRIYNHSISEYDERNQDSLFNSISVTDLKYAIVDYENMMKSNVWYTNTKPAYDSYVLANRYLDAINYGGETVDKIKLYAATSQLVNNTKLMKKWEKTTFTPAMSSYKDDNDNGMRYTYSNVCTNLLRCSSVDNDSYTVWGAEQGVYTGSNKNTVQPAIFRPSAVMVYDGTDPSIPVMFLERLWKGGAFGGLLNMWTFYSALAGDTQGMYLNENWRGTEGNLNFLNCYYGHTASSLNYTYKELDSFYKISRGSSKGEYKYYFANKLYFDGNSFNSGEYVRTVKGLTWAFHFTNDDDPYHNSGDSHMVEYAVSEGAREGINTNEVEQPLYVINYKAIIDAMANYKAPLLNVENYKEGGLSNVLEKYDALANFDFVKEYNWDNNLEDSARRCGEKMNSLISGIRSVSPVRNNGYSALRQNLTSYKNIYNDSTLSSKYSESSVNAFLTAYTNGKNEMASLVNNGYSLDEARINAMATEINNAYKNLKKGFAITFVDENDNEIKTINLEEGATAQDVLAVAPRLPDDGIYGDYIYTYSWGDVVPVSADATYKITKTQGEDVSAYITAVTLARACLADTEKYPQDERDYLSSVLKANVVRVSSTRQEIDAYTDAITTATNMLQLEKFTVTYQVQVDNEVVSSEQVVYRFGDMFSAEIPANTNVYKWISVVDGVDSIIARNTDSINYSIESNVTIIACAFSGASQTTDVARVVLMDNSNRVASTVYAPVGAEIEIAEDGYIVSGNKTVAKRIPFYNIAGFEINDTVMTNGSKITISNTDDIIIHTCYSAK